MKLSSISFDEMTNILAVLAVEIQPLLEDEEIIELLNSTRKIENETHKEYGLRTGRNMFSLLGLMSLKHKEAFHRILGVLFNCPSEEIGKKPMKEIMDKLKETLGDEVLVSFLPQFGKLVRSGL
ncbi:MAG: hypothetical protein FWE24_09180 [Defluviitaleaceae bacterium]|nr:hypothetical protein [Defluviitaleaceae bacterium]